MVEATNQNRGDFFRKKFSLPRPAAFSNYTGYVQIYRCYYRCNICSRIAARVCTITSDNGNATDSFLLYLLYFLCESVSRARSRWSRAINARNILIAPCGCDHVAEKCACLCVRVCARARARARCFTISELNSAEICIARIAAGVAGSCAKGSERSKWGGG